MRNHLNMELIGTVMGIKLHSFQRFLQCSLIMDFFHFIQNIGDQWTEEKRNRRGQAWGISPSSDPLFNKNSCCSLGLSSWVYEPHFHHIVSIYWVPIAFILPSGLKSIGNLHCSLTDNICVPCYRKHRMVSWIREILEHFLWYMRLSA